MITDMKRSAFVMRNSITVVVEGLILRAERALVCTVQFFPRFIFTINQF